MNTCTAENLLNKLHGEDCEFLSRQSIIDFAEQYAKLFHAHSMRQLPIINDTYSEKRKPFPPTHSTDTPISEQP